MFSLKGKKALVTGSSRGIGRGIALALAKQGADVCINYHSQPEKAEEVVAEIKKLGQEAFAVQADVSQKEAVAKMFAAVKEKWGQLDILVNNAGILSYAPIEKLTEDQWNGVINVNLKGQFLCCQQAAQMMKEKGRIINISSIASGGVGVGFNNLSHYAASKGGVIGLTETLALELGPKGITVNAVAPGAINTDMASTDKMDEKTLQGLMARIPRRRIGEPEDIGVAVAFLASDEADYVTGVTLNVDGGWLTS